MIQDMNQSFLSLFVSQLKANSSGSKGESSQDQAYKISRDQDQELEQDPSPSLVDHVNPPEGEEGELTSEKEDPDLHQRNPNLSQLVLTEEELRDFDSFNEASTNFHSKKGKTRLWKVSQENTKFYSQAQQANHRSDSMYSSMQSQLQAKKQTTILTNNEAGSQY